MQFLIFFPLQKERYFVFDASSDPHYKRGGIFNLNINPSMSYHVGFRGLKHHRYIDAAMVMRYKGARRRASFIFQDEWVYKWDLLDANWDRHLIPSERVAKDWPKKISEVFPGLPNNIDTAFTWGVDGNTYFFKGEHQYVWNRRTNRVDGPTPFFNDWKDVCDVYLCQVAPKPQVYQCESWELTKENCIFYCT